MLLKEDNYGVGALFVIISSDPTATEGLCF